MVTLRVIMSFILYHIRIRLPEKRSFRIVGVLGVSGCGGKFLTVSGNQYRRIQEKRKKRIIYRPEKIRNRLALKMNHKIKEIHSKGLQLGGHLSTVPSILQNIAQKNTHVSKKSATFRLFSQI